MSAVQFHCLNWSREFQQSFGALIEGKGEQSINLRFWNSGNTKYAITWLLQKSINFMRGERLSFSCLALFKSVKKLTLLCKKNCILWRLVCDLKTVLLCKFMMLSNFYRVNIRASENYLGRFVCCLIAGSKSAICITKSRSHTLKINLPKQQKFQTACVEMCYKM